MRFEKTDKVPLLDFGIWKETEERWKKEGMISLAAENSAYDGPMQSCWFYGPFQGPIPAFDSILIKETDEYSEYTNAQGQTVRNMKGSTSMPHFIDFPVKNRSDWDSYKTRFDPYSIGRYPDNWDALVEKRKTTENCEIRGLAVWGFFGFPREMMGIENLSLMYYDDPELITDMNKFWSDYTIERLERAVREMEFDYALIWEDNCYKNGMLHSPRIFNEFMAPYYTRLIAFFKRHGIDMISVDSDGNVNELIPLLLDVGVTAIHPFEVAAGMDVVEIGQKFPELQIWGGIDKRALAEGPAAIDAELERVLVPMKKRGGYAAGLDHGVPSNVPLENYRYFVKKIQEYL
ncbi:MAG: uroporphyrinogen decarboxylase family protein [Saccharofermentanales bacterium]